jgi:hypothetical protein
MPLIKSGSREAIAANIRTESQTKPHKQAVAIALDVARRAKGRAYGGPMGAPPPSLMQGYSWFEKREARNLGHTGPVVSAVPGRTDRHSIKVPSGSFVLPADTVSHLGQSNSIAGMKAASHIFGHAGPYGSGHGMSIGHGPGAPALPHPPKVSKLASGGSDEGGARGDEDGQLVDVIVAGGEHVIPPFICRNIGRAARAGSAEKGARIPYHPDDLKIGHAVLDKFVMNTRADHVKTLKKLPEPATR